MQLPSPGLEPNASADGKERMHQCERLGELSLKKPAAIPHLTSRTAPYLLMSCFDCSRPTKTLMLCFCASIVVAASAALASASAPSKSPAADFKRADARCPKTVSGAFAATVLNIAMASSLRFCACSPRA